MKNLIGNHFRELKGSKSYYIYIIAVAGLIGTGFLGYTLGINYHNRVKEESELRTSAVFSRLAEHDQAVVSLNSGRKSIELLEKDKVSSGAASEVYLLLRKAFTDGSYDSVASLSASLTEAIELDRERDSEMFEQFNKKIMELSKKRDDYKKQGVNVATVSAAIASASAALNDKSYITLGDDIKLIDSSLGALLAAKKEADRKAALAAALFPAPVAPQSAGGITYERKTINTVIGSFSVDMLTVDLNRIRVKTFTASDSDCSSNCPLKPLAAYVAENGGVAGINGSYFCPADYPTCSSKVNAFDLLVFDYRSKHYANSSQNQYSVNPLISFYGDGAHYYTQALGFGRDTSAYGAISNFPTLIHNGGVAVNNGLDAKSSGTKSIRGGIGYSGKTLWAVMTRGATVPDTAYVFKALGAQFAMNLDGGGSAALYFGGYKVGPGRQLPNAVVFTN